MVSSRKRGRQEMEAPAAIEPPKEPSLLDRLRNMWEFANLAQWIFIFGRAVKIDENFDIEELEMECLKPHSALLPEIGLALLKFVSSHRGLTPELFDEYTRRQYVAKAPNRNPFGVEEEPARFTEFDIVTKIRVLQQLTQWTMGNPDRIREKMEEQKDAEQTIWRIEAFGWDSDDRTYIVLDDNRLYRQTDPPPLPPPAAKPKRGSKKAKAALRASKRRKVSDAADSEGEDADETPAEPKEDDGFGGMKWECLAVTLDEFNSFVASIEKSKDPNEKILRKRIVDDVLPILEKHEEARKRKAAQKERELLNLEKLATAKRSSRIAGKLEQQRQEEEARETERKKRAELEMAKKEQNKWMKLEKERESRMMTREQRLKEREARRILHEEELANLSEDSKRLESGEKGRLSERHLKAEIERKKQALEELAEEEDWIFDCICGAYGQIDDGTHSIACDKCNIWQHSKCVGVSETEADREDFTFICKTCVRRAEEEERAKAQPPLKIKFRSSQNSFMTGKESLGNGVDESSMVPSPQKPHHQSQGALPPIHLFPTNGHHSSGCPGLDSPYQQPSRAENATRDVHHTALPNTSPQQLSASARSSPPALKAVTNPELGVVASAGRDTNGGSPSLPPPYSIPKPANPFSSPVPHSPTSLPPPVQPSSYTFANGYLPHSNNSNLPEGQAGGTPIPRTMGSTSPKQAAPLNHNYGTPSQPFNGHQNGSIQETHRRSSINLPSPLVGAPVLTPVNKASHMISPPFNYQANNFTPGGQPPKTNILPPGSSPPAHVHSQQDIGHAAAIPTVNGISPTKHSPPRPSTSNGTTVSPTPSILPPFTSLSPSPQFQNLSPPVKSADIERNRPSGQPAAQ